MQYEKELNMIKKSYTNFYFLPKKLRENIDFIIKAVNINYLVLTLIKDERLRNNENILINAVKNNFNTMHYIKDIKNDEFYQKCIDVNVKAIIHTPYSIKNKIENIIKLVEYNYKYLHLFSYKSKNIRKVFIKFCKNYDFNNSIYLNLSKYNKDYKYNKLFNINNFINIVLKF